MKIDILKQEFARMSVSDLQEKLEAARRELFSLRLNKNTTHNKDYSLIKKLRKEIARILTYIQLQTAKG